MQDVADRAGVSLAAVSMVINGKVTTKVSAKTRERILAAAAALNYRPNAIARQLSRASSSFIGLVTDSVATTPFAGRLISGAQDAAWEEGQVLLIANTEGVPRAEHDAISMMHEHQVRGIVYSSWYHHQLTPPPDLANCPAVLANCFARGKAFQSFVPDEVQGGRTATEILLERGHRRIAFINGSFGVPCTTGRLKGYRTALSNYGLPFDADLLLTAKPDQDGGYRAGQRLLSMAHPPSGVFCYNDRMAMGLYDALREGGLKIPDDMAVVGFDNQEIIAAHLRPALSTVALPHYEIGYQSVKWLLAHNLEPAARIRPARVICPPVVRHSAAAFTSGYTLSARD
jgi:LacI family transcriptional regulator